MRRDFLKTAAVAGAGLAGSTAWAQGAAATGLRGNASDVYVMNVMVSGVEYWFPVYEMMKQLGRTLGIEDVDTVIITNGQVPRLHLNPAHIDRLIDFPVGANAASRVRTDVPAKDR